MAYCFFVPCRQDARSTWVTSAGICIRLKYSRIQDIPLGKASCAGDVVGLVMDAVKGCCEVESPRADPLETAGGEETKVVSATAGQSVLPWRCLVEFSVGTVAED